MLLKNWFLFKSTDELYLHLLKNVLNLAEFSIKQKNFFSVVLSGGTSFIKLYKLLKEADSEWNKWKIYISDERCLPKNDKDRNDFIINSTWLNNNKIPSENINFIKPEIGVTESIKEYKINLNKIDKFDLILLGMGEDGHTASLFPGRLYDDCDVIEEKYAPKYPPSRISLSFQRLNLSKNVFKVIVGNSKNKALKLWSKGEDLPISKISGDNEQVFIDKNIID